MRETTPESAPKASVSSESLSCGAAVVAEAADERVLADDEVARPAGLADAALTAVPADADPLARLPGGDVFADGVDATDYSWPVIRG